MAVVGIIHNNILELDSKIEVNLIFRLFENLVAIKISINSQQRTVNSVVILIARLAFKSDGNAAALDESIIFTFYCRLAKKSGKT